MSARLPITIGSASGLTPAINAVLQRNAFGVDYINRPFTCPTDRVEALVPAPGMRDIRYPNLFATGNYTSTEKEGLQSEVLVEYKGLLNGALPDVIISIGLSTSSVSQTAGDAGPAETQRTWEIVYFSPSRTFRYVTNTEPTAPKYNSYISVLAPSIITQSIRDGNGRPRTSAPNISMTPYAQVTGFKGDQVPGSKGPLFEVEETWSGYFRLTANS